ncbi:hypothetical protein [Leisingera sp.]|uniref:hypothetical protein n=1 Tax=Leisingera sp. TaxID=1879318 RepID=UPI002B2799BE|nr:hypothetical protein [Leisingera sp.]
MAAFTLHADSCSTTCNLARFCAVSSTTATSLKKATYFSLMRVCAVSPERPPVFSKMSVLLMLHSRLLTLRRLFHCWQCGIGNQILSINGYTGSPGDGALKQRISKGHSHMPMIEKANCSRPLITIFAVAALIAQTSAAQEWRTVQPGQSGWAIAAAGGAGAGRSFQFAYGRQLGGMIVSGTVTMEQSGLLTTAVQAEETHQLRLHAGYDFGPATGFVTLGGVQAETSSGSRQGPLFGLGMRVPLTRTLQVTGELLHHEAGPRDGSASPHGETLSVSAAFRF